MTVIAATNEPLWMQEVLYPARIDRQLIRATWTEGVLGGFGLRQKSGGANMSVDVLAGYAIVDGDDQARQGAYVLSTDATVNVPLDPAASQPRIDLVILRVSDTFAGGSAGPYPGSIEYLAGVPAASPSAPAVPASAIELGRINVAANDLSITDAEIDTTYRGRSGPRSVAGLLLAFGNTGGGADYARSPALQQVSGETGNIGFSLAERSIVRFDAHMTGYGTAGKSLLTYIKLNKGTAAIDAGSAEVAFARAQFDTTGVTGSVSPRPMMIHVLDPGSYRCGFWCESNVGWNFTIYRSRDIPQLWVTNMGPTSRPITF